MKVSELKKLLEQLEDNSEVVVLREGNGQCCMPDAEIVSLSSCYFGGLAPDVEDEDADCLLLIYH